MQIYFYAKSGHTIGLEQTKKCSALINQIKEFEPILCTSDFRAGAFAKELFGIKKYVNIDVLRNLPNIMHRNDILLYDSNEVNEEMKKEIQEFCSFSFDLQEIKEAIVDTSIYEKNENPKLEKTFFFGDDDYDNLLIKLLEKNDIKYNVNLLMGHYFFLGNEKIFTKHFKEVLEEEEYVETIQNSKFLLTTSLQSAFEAITCGNKPVLLKREDKIYDKDLLELINIPQISENSIENIMKSFDDICENYANLENFSLFDFTSIKEQITHKIETFNKLTNS